MEPGIRERLQEFAFKYVGKDAKEYLADYLERMGRDVIQDMDMPVLNSMIILDRRDEDGKTAFERFREEKAPRLTAGQLEILDRLGRSRWGLFQVLEVEPGMGSVLEDCITGETLDLRDISSSHRLRRFSLMYGKIYPGRGAWIGEGLMITLPSSAKEGAIKILEDIGVKRGDPGYPDVISRHAVEAFARIFHLRNEPPVKRLITHEGDPVMIAEVECSGVKREQAFLALDGHPDMYLDEESASEVSFTWAKKAPDPSELPEGEEGTMVVSTSMFDPDEVDEQKLVLATITVDDDSIRVEASSQARMDRAVSLLQELFPDIRVGERRLQPWKQAAQEAPAKRADPPKLPPEIEERILGPMRAKHIEQWLDDAIPALDGRTPREAAKDPRLRPRLVDLLRDQAGCAGLPGAFLTFEDVEKMADELGVQLAQKRT